MVEASDVGVHAGAAAEQVEDVSLRLLRAVADPTRWRILARLAEGPECVCRLQEHVPLAPNLMSYHLRILREAGLVGTTRRGRWIDYGLAAGALDRLHAALPAAAAAGRRSRP